MFEGRRRDETVRDEQAVAERIGFDQGHCPLRDCGVDWKDDDLSQELADVLHLGYVAATDEEFHRGNDTEPRASTSLLGRDEGDRVWVTTLGVDEDVGVDQSVREAR